MIGYYFFILVLLVLILKSESFSISNQVVFRNLKAVHSLKASSNEGNSEINPTKLELDSQSSSLYIPMVDFEGTKVDINSRLLHDRIIVIGKSIEDDFANSVIAQLLYLSHQDSSKDIKLYINSPGGSVSAGMAIFDTMKFIECDVSTICFGRANGISSFLLASGTKGKRFATQNSRIVLHQPLASIKGQATDIEIQANEILYVRSQMNTYLSQFTNNPIEKIEKDYDRDVFMTSKQALEYGLIDHIVKSK